MKQFTKNNYLFNFIKIFLIINIFYFCQTQDEDCIIENSTCLKIILYKNGTIDKECVPNLVDIEKYKDDPYSIAFDDKIIIFECEKNETVECIYNNTNSPCSELNTTNKDYNCCQLKEYNNATGKENETCIEINKYEFERFKGLGEKQFKENLNDKKNNISILICFSKLYKINKSLLFLFLLIFSNF